MSFHRVANGLLSALCAGGLLLASCSDDDERPPGNSVFPTGGAGGAGGSGGTGAAGGAAGAAGTAGTGGTGPGTCGNNLIEPGEECDGTAIDEGDTCVSLGFESGVLACVGCELDVSGCLGDERCYDGIDNDGDGYEDCYDDDCADVCSDPCAFPVVLEDPGTVKAHTRSFPDNLESSCIRTGDASGPDMVFSVVPTNTGVVEALLVSQSADQTLSVRTDCDQASAELACSNYTLGASATERVIVPSQQGVPLFIIVDGANTNERGSFEISAQSRVIVCGDGSRDPGEECDDGNKTDGDGCSASCKLESSEVEPNDDVSSANPYQTRFIAAMDPAGDVDVISVVASEPGSNFSIFVRDLGDDACVNELMDPVVEVYGNGGSTLVGEDDDGGQGFCSQLLLTDLSPDTYYLFVRAAGGAAPTFPYRLDVLVDHCGNGVKSLAEECDDGNLQSGDGCSDTCRLE